MTDTQNGKQKTLYFPLQEGKCAKYHDNVGRTCLC